jgi:hypothetical protein
MSIERKSISLAGKTFYDTDIKAMPTTYLEIIPAPKSNQIIIPLYVTLHLKSTVAYTNFDTLMALYLARGASGSKIYYHNSPDLLLGQAASYTSKMWEASNLLDAIMTDADTDVTGKALNLKMDNALGNLTGGAAGNKLTIAVLYYLSNLEL